MKRQEFARKLARETKQSSARAQDQIDVLVHKILKSLRQGRPVRLPGMGKLVSPQAGEKAGPGIR